MSSSTGPSGGAGSATTSAGATVALVQHKRSRHRAFFLEAFRANPDIAAVALLDPAGDTAEGTAAEARKLLGDKTLRVYTDLDALLRAETPAMAIATMTGAEAPGAIAPLLEAGLHVLAEKPACVNAGDFARLVDLADRKQRHLMLALCNRVAPWVPDARRIIHEGGLGRLYAARVLNVADQTRIWVPRTRDWSFNRADAGGGHLIWLGIHWLDMLLYLTGERPTEVQAMAGNVGGGPIDVEDLATVNIRLGDGAQASLISGYVLDANKQIDLTLWGSKGWLRFDMATAAIDWHSPAAAMNDAVDRRLTYNSTGPDLYTYFVRDCLRACLDGTPPPITGAEALTVLRTIFAAYEAAETGRTVKL